MEKHGFAILLLLIINVGDFFVMGQSTVGDSCNGEQNNYQSDACYHLANSIQSDFQNLKGQISRMENCVESHKPKLSGSLCPRGFNYTVSGFLKCYAVLTQTGPWDAAQKRCRQLHKDSHLAVINRASEQQIISKIIQNYNCLKSWRDSSGALKWQECFWIGGQVRNISDCRSTFLWKPDNRTSFPIGFNNWDSGEPNCHMDIEKCLALRGSGHWNDLACAWYCCSVCEVTPYM